MPQNNRIEPMEAPKSGRNKAVAVIGAAALAVTVVFVGYLMGLYEPASIIALAR